MLIFKNWRRLNKFTGKLQRKISLAYCLPKNFDHRIKNQKFCRFMKLSDEPIRFTTREKCRSQFKALWITRLFLRYIRLLVYVWTQDLKGCVVKRQNFAVGRFIFFSSRVIFISCIVFIRDSNEWVAKIQAFSWFSCN